MTASEQCKQAGLKSLADHNRGAANMTTKERTQKINQLQKKYPGTTRQRNWHGANSYSVEFFSKKTGELVARFSL